MIETKTNSQFNLDYGTKPTAATLEKIDVTINDDVMIGDYGRAYSAELDRRNPLRAHQAKLDPETLTKYFTQILALRVQYVHDQCKVWRQIKQLNIPTWIQFVISQVGRVVDYDYGLMILPQFNCEIDLDFLLDVSLRLEAFKSDGVSMHKDAFPRSKDGDKDVMTMALIDGYVCSMRTTAHPISSYVSAFLGVKLMEEQAFKILYRVRYDDVQFIKQMLTSEASLI